MKRKGDSLVSKRSTKRQNVLKNSSVQQSLSNAPVYLHDDCWLEVFHHLPSVSISVLKFVSKQLKNLSDQFFMSCIKQNLNAADVPINKIPLSIKLSISKAGYLSLLEKAAFLITAKDYSTLASVLQVINSRAAVDVMAMENFESGNKKISRKFKNKKIWDKLFYQDIGRYNEALIYDGTDSCCRAEEFHSSFILVGEGNKFIEVKNICSIASSAEEGRSIHFENEIKLKKLGIPKYEKKIEEGIFAKEIDWQGNLIDEPSSDDSDSAERFIEAWNHHFDYDRRKMLRVRNWLSWKTVSPIEMATLLLRLTIRPLGKSFQPSVETLNMDGAIDNALRAYLNDNSAAIHIIEYVTQMLLPKLSALNNLQRYEIKDLQTKKVMNNFMFVDWYTYWGDSPEGEYTGVRGAIQIVASKNKSKWVKFLFEATTSEDNSREHASFTYKLELSSNEIFELDEDAVEHTVELLNLKMSPEHFIELLTTLLGAQISTSNISSYEIDTYSLVRAAYAVNHKHF